MVISFTAIVYFSLHVYLYVAESVSKKDGMVMMMNIITSKINSTVNIKQYFYHYLAHLTFVIQMSNLKEVYMAMMIDSNRIL